MHLPRAPQMAESEKKWKKRRPHQFISLFVMTYTVIGLRLFLRPTSPPEVALVLAFHFSAQEMVAALNDALYHGTFRESDASSIKLFQLYIKSFVLGKRAFKGQDTSHGDLDKPSLTYCVLYMLENSGVPDSSDNKL